MPSMDDYRRAASRGSRSSGRPCWTKACCASGPCWPTPPTKTTTPPRWGHRRARRRRGHVLSAEPLRGPDRHPRLRVQLADQRRDV